MIKRSVIGFLSLGLLCTCVMAAKPSATNPHKIKFDSKQVTAKSSNKITSQMFNVDPFERISLNGPINLEIIAGTPLHDIRLIGTQALVDLIKVESVGKELRVNLISDNPPQGRVVAIARTNQFNRLNLVGKGTVKAIGVNTPKLDIFSEYAGMIDIKGRRIGLEVLKIENSGLFKINGIETSKLTVKATANNVVKLGRVKRLAHFDYSGNGTIELKPINSHYLNITGSGHATSIIQGLVDNLELNLFGNAVFDGRDLKTHSAFVKTHDSAQAHIYVLKNQHAFANDNSDILFYNQSSFIGSHMMGSGAVLNYARVASAQTASP